MLQDKGAINIRDTIRQNVNSHFQIDFQISNLNYDKLHRGCDLMSVYSCAELKEKYDAFLANREKELTLVTTR